MMPRLSHVDRVVDPPGSEQDPEQPEDRARRTDRRDVAAEHEASGRARPPRRRGRTAVNRRDPYQRSTIVPARYSAYMLNARWRHVAVQEGHRPQPPVLARGHSRLVELEPLVQEPGPRSANSAVSETIVVTAMMSSVSVNRGRRPAPGEVALRRPTVAGLLAQPAEPVGDLGLVLVRGAAIGFAVGVERAVEVAVADTRRRDVPPRR